MSERLRQTDTWIAWVRLAAIPFALFEVGVFTPTYAAGYERWAWLTTGVFVAGAVVLFRLSRRDLALRRRLELSVAALAFDTAVVVAYVFVYAFERDSQIELLLVFPVIEAAFRFGLRGGLALPVVLVPALVLFELDRSHRFDLAYNFDHVTFPLGIWLVIGAIVGRLTDRLQAESEVAKARADDAERLRDQLGRRVDLLDAANRCARALSSSLELGQAFNAFIREVRGLMPFDRLAIVLAEEGRARVMATAGVGVERVFPAGSFGPARGSLLDEVLQGHTVYREDMDEARYPEERDFVALGLRSRLAAPLLVGPRAIGMVSLLRAEPAAFDEDEIELLGLLGRLVASAVQNIRSYEAERETVEELRRLSSLRADFVSLVSHELRSPMATVLGSARTLQQRWRELEPEQRESFLALIGDETERLAALVADVLDTSRIEAGTFSYAFSDVDVAELVRESVAAARLGHDEVTVKARLREPLPRVRADRERLRQVLANLIENAVKYTSVGDGVEVSAQTRNGLVRIAVRDHGPGIAREHQQLIFEKFGRVVSGSSTKRGTGLGLFIARSIAEAHGGTLEVHSEAGAGAEFTLELPI